MVRLDKEGQLVDIVQGDSVVIVLVDPRARNMIAKTNEDSLLNSHLGILILTRLLYWTSHARLAFS